MSSNNLESCYYDTVLLKRPALHNPGQQKIESALIGQGGPAQAAATPRPGSEVAEFGTTFLLPRLPRDVNPVCEEYLSTALMYLLISLVGPVRVVFSGPHPELATYPGTIRQGHSG